MKESILVTTERDGQVERIVLNRPKGNILDKEMLAALIHHLQALTERPGARKLVVFAGAGAHFSFGASVAEHRKEQVGEFLAAFHLFFRTLEACGIPTAAVVRGQCLGGGCELALWSGRIFCHPTAQFGLPESKLGVFPPVAALALPWRIGGSRATQLILSGESMNGVAAESFGLADEHSVDPEAALQTWFERALAPKSAVAVRAAWRASRRPLARALETELPELETYYLRDLMAHRDPLEGITAFMEKRPPRWSDA